MSVSERIYYQFIKFGSVLFKGLSVCERRYRIISAKAHGMRVGANTKFVGTQDFGSEPYLISIGEACLITDCVRFITHDGAIQVPLIKNGAAVLDIYGNHSTFGQISMGNNVFLGVGTIILSGTVIGDNTIIAAGSVVKGIFEGNSVVAGNPARVICTVDEYLSRSMPRILNLTGLLQESRKMAIFNSVSINSAIPPLD